MSEKYILVLIADGTNGAALQLPVTVSSKRIPSSCVVAHPTHPTPEKQGPVQSAERQDLVQASLKVHMPSPHPLTHSSLQKTCELILTSSNLA